MKKRYVGLLIAAAPVSYTHLDVYKRQSLDVVEIGKLKSGTKVYFDKAAFEADLVVPVNRVKIHTDFVADIQSGLCKMLVIGLGNHVGCTSIHEESFDHFGEVLKEAAAMIMQSANIGFGVAVLELSLIHI